MPRHLTDARRLSCSGRASRMLGMWRQSCQTAAGDRTSSRWVASYWKPRQAACFSMCNAIGISSPSSKEYPVEVRVYNIDRYGMRNLAPTVLKKKLDAIWHCGIAVYGSEYCPPPGGSLQVVKPHLSPSGLPAGWRAHPGYCSQRIYSPRHATTTQDAWPDTPDRSEKKKTNEQPLFLSDIIAFQSSVEPNEDDVAVAAAKADDIIDRATKVLEAAREALANQSSMPPLDTKKIIRESTSPSGPSVNRFTPESINRELARSAAASSSQSSAQPPTDQASSSSAADERKRRILQSALSNMEVSNLFPEDDVDDDEFRTSGSASSPRSSSNTSWTPDWAQGLISDNSTFGSMLQPFLSPQTEAKGANHGRLAYADPDAGSSTLNLRSQAEEDADWARSVTELPPLQSVLELTSAFRPPVRSGQAEAAPEAGLVTATTQQAKELADGKAILADGTRFEKLSGEERGENGYWCRWHVIRGLTADATVAWEETWWETSDWFGLKEMGAEKTGQAEDGSSWKERWTEKVYYHPDTLEPVVERAAHKWAHDASGDEWEEKWNEYFSAKGRVTKSADKWGKQGPNVWHEAWGEDYDGNGACVKWTDKWAERIVAGGGREQWGDKWEEKFGAGQGTKKGEVWNVDAAGNRYNRYWGEDHLGNGLVRRHGHSTSGEQWDFTDSGDTYYNPNPHFGFHHAYSHSPQLMAIPVLPKDDPQGRFGGLGPGIDEL